MNTDLCLKDLTREQLESLYFAAMADSESAIERSIKAETDLKCLEESTVDSKAYEALQQQVEQLQQENDKLKRELGFKILAQEIADEMGDWKDSVYTQGELYDLVDELRTSLETAHQRAEQFEQENERLKALVPDIVQVFGDAAEKLEKEVSQ